MGLYDDNLWDLASEPLFKSTVLNRPRSSNSHVTNASVNRLFDNISEERKKKLKRSKTVHVYGQENVGLNSSSVNYKDPMNLLSKTKSQRDLVTQMNRIPLSDLATNTSSKAEVKKIDLIDLDRLSSQSSHSEIPTYLLPDPINLLENRASPRLPSFHEEVAVVKSQMSCIQLNEIVRPVLERSTTMPVSGNQENRDCIHFASDSIIPILREDTIDDSEEEHEILSISSSMRKMSGYSTESQLEYMTMNTSIMVEQRKCLTKINDNIHSQTELEGGNFQEEDLTAGGDSFGDYGHFDDDLDSTISIHETEKNKNCAESSMVPNINLVTKSSHDFDLGAKSLDESMPSKEFITEMNDHDRLNEGDHQYQNLQNENFSITQKTSAKTIDEVDIGKINSNLKTSEAQSLLNKPQKKRKPTLSELCSKTNSAKKTYRVGLSKKIRVDSLHNMNR